MPPVNSTRDPRLNRWTTRRWQIIKRQIMYMIQKMGHGWSIFRKIRKLKSQIYMTWVPHFVNEAEVTCKVANNRHDDASGDWLCGCVEPSWWRHQIKIFSALLAFWAGNSPVTSEFPTQRPVTRSFDVFFEPRVEQTMEMLVIWDAIALIMMSL